MKRISLIASSVLMGTLLLTACSDAQGEPLKDTQTKEILSTVEQNNDTYLMDWLSDSMDRGNHDFLSDHNGKLVLSKVVESIERGEVIHYKLKDENQLGRVVGLPGETVEIKDGQVYIDGFKLDTFYGVATIRGMTKEEFFNLMPSDNYDKEVAEDFFNTNMEPVQVEDETVFLLVDSWSRGLDSREYGLISNENIEGKVLGYMK